jgi:hypothetical protein
VSRTANDFSTFIELVRYRGDGPISIPLTSPDDGTDFTPTGNALIFTLKADPADLDVDALVQKVSTVGGITVANPSVVTLVPADFTDLAPDITYHFDIQAQLAASPNTIRTVARGTIRFAYDVTQETTISIPTTTTNPGVGYTWANIPDTPAAIAAVAALTPAADKVPYYTGAAAAALATLTAFGRSLIAAVDAAAAKVLLGLGNVDNTSDANKPVSTAQATADGAVASAAAGALTTAIGALTAASAVANNSGNTTITLAAGQKIAAAVITVGGSAGTRIVVLDDANAVAGAVVALNLVLPTTASITVEIRTGAAAGALLATVTTDGTAGTVGVVCTRGASAWNDPTQAAWID